MHVNLHYFFISRVQILKALSRVKTPKLPKMYNNKLTLLQIILKMYNRKKKLKK